MIYEDKCKNGALGGHQIEAFSSSKYSGRLNLSGVYGKYAIVSYT